MDSITPPGVEDHEDDLRQVIVDSSDTEDDEDLFRSSSLSWLRRIKKEESYGKVDEHWPKDAPDFLVLYTDLVEAGWGWKRLVPCEFGGCVEWPDFKKYLVQYYHRNTDTKVDDLVAKPAPVEQPDNVAAKGDALCAAVNQCVEAEFKLIRTGCGKLTLEDCALSRDIRDRAKQLLQSGCKSSISTAALHCITKEDELLCDLFTCQDISEALTFANEVRRSASNLMLFKGPECDAAAAAAGIILGLTREAEVALFALNNQYEFATTNFIMAVDARQRVVGALTKLEEELLCKTADTAGDGTLIGADRVQKGSSNSSGSSDDIIPAKNDKDGKELMTVSTSAVHDDKGLAPRVQTSMEAAPGCSCSSAEAQCSCEWVLL